MVLTALVLLCRRGGDGEGLSVVLDRVLGQSVGDIDENLPDVGRVLGRRLQEDDAVLLGKGPALLRLHHPLILQIRLVTGQCHDDVGVASSLQLLHPALGSVEGVLVGHVVHHDGGRSPSVVHGSERSVPLLTSRIPNLKLDGRIVDCDRLSQKGG